VTGQTLAPSATGPGCACCAGGTSLADPAAPAAPDRVEAAAITPSGDDVHLIERIDAARVEPPAPPPQRADGATALTARVVERVVEIVQRLQMATPPQTMVVELPDVQGARIAVSLQAGGGITLAFSGLASGEIAPLVPQVSAGLAAQGIELAGWSSEGEELSDQTSGQQPEPEEDPRRWGRRNPGFDLSA
jgi:hypothetical protein